MIEQVIDAIGPTWATVIAIIDILCLISILFTERVEPKKFLLWALIFLAFPLIGLIAYLFVGQTFYDNRSFRLKCAKEKESKIIDDWDKLAIEERADIDETKARVMRSIRSAVGPAYTDNNDVKLFTVGQDKFDSLFNDLRNAKKYIHIEYYILRDDELGNEFMDILIQKAKEGVQVRFLSDYVGMGKGPMKKVRMLKKAGGKYACFHSMSSVLLSPKKNNRNHRKFAIIDGLISYCGGFNIGDEYLGKGPLGYWRDSAVRIVGAATTYLHIRFAMDWEYAAKETIDLNNGFYTPEESYNEFFGSKEIQIVSGGPDVAYYNPIRMQYLEMFRTAKKTIWFHTPYLIPNDSVIDTLRIAAGSGVDVRIIIPDKPDHMFVFWNNIYSANRLMESGVKVYMYNKGFVHSKTVVVDGEYCSVGSANMDDRSLVLNFETNAMIYSREIGMQMMEAFENDLKDCTQYSCEEYEKRGKIAKVKIAVSKLFKDLA